MSAYENVVSGKLKLKGKALDVQSGGLKKKKKKNKPKHDQYEDSLAMTNLAESSTDPQSTDAQRGPSYVDSLTRAEKRYIEQRDNIDIKKLAKTANKSHRDRIEDFNQYLANLSEHYDIPKVGPG
ncbi:7-dehydrocholesterol reductase-like protein [Wolffia australiana]